MQIRIREAKRKELNKVIQLEQKVLYPELSAKELEQWVKDEESFESKIFIIEKNGVIVGFAVYEIYEVSDEEMVLTLDAFGVNEKYQRQGIGRNLLLTSLKQAIEFYQEDRRFKVVGLLIQTDFDAAGFYEKVFPVENFQRKDFFKVWSSGEPLVICFISI